ncbi:Meckelin [Gaertneriomyces sp. JEL0708]|nr:Meckelin [Gaertneriomyces sp. JEL0708]
MRSYTCGCPSAFVQQGSRCIAAADAGSVLDDWNSPDPKIIKYQDVITNAGITTITLQSDTFASLYIRAISGCQQSDVQSCSILANLCALQLYDDTSTVCRALYQLKSSRGGQAVPTIDLNSGTSNSTLNLDNYPMSELELVLARYALNGTFTGLEEVADQIAFCVSDAKANTWRRIGSNYQISCDIDIRAATNSSMGQTQFLELYLKRQDSTLIPIPIAISNTRATSADSGQPKYFSRFFLVDAASGIEGGQLKVARIAENMHIDIRKAANGISIPTLNVAYTEHDLSSSSTTVRTTRFSAAYTSPSQSFLKTLTPISAISCVLAGLIGLWRIRAWSLRNDGKMRLTGWDLNFFGRCILILAATLAPILYALLFFSSLYFYIAYKSTTAGASSIFLPSDVSAFEAVLYATVTCSALSTARLLYKQCSMDVFFMDWEKSKGRIISHGVEEKGRLATVSVWRLILVGNLWSMVQRYRRVHIPGTLVALYFLLEALGLRYTATEQPDLNDLSPGPTNPLLLFCIDSLLLLALALTQYVFHRLAYERFYKNPLMDLFDMCSLANISILMLDEWGHGYYVHGRSVHGIADTNLAELNEYLKREEMDLVPKRGLGGTDDQIFEVYLQTPMKEALGKVWSAVLEDIETHGRRPQRFPGIKSATDTKPLRKFTSIEETKVRGYETVNHFLKGFFDKNLKDYTYTLTTRLGFFHFLHTPSTQASSTLVPIAHAPPVTLASLDPYLFILYSLVFAAVDIRLDSAGKAAIVVLVIDWVLRFVRSIWSERNAVRKGVGDGKFLL